MQDTTPAEHRPHQDAQDLTEAFDCNCLTTSPVLPIDLHNPERTDIHSNNDRSRLLTVRAMGRSKNSAIRIKSETPDTSSDMQCEIGTQGHINVSQDYMTTRSSLYPSGLDTTSNPPAGFELRNNNPRSRIDADITTERESLFVSDMDELRSVRAMETDSSHEPHILGSEESNDLDLSKDFNASDEVELGPLATWVAEGSSWQLGNSADAQSQIVQSPIPDGNHQDLLGITSENMSRVVEDDDTRGLDSDYEAAIEVGEVSGKSQKKKAERKKTGPRPKSAKEWFAKRPKDPRETLPQLAGVKRKRSKKDKFESSRSGKRKRLGKSESDKKGKKGHQKKGSIKVMTGMFERLRHSNPMEARMALGDMPEADPIVATTKENQLQQIMKSLPKDATKASTRGDRKKLTDATRSFGYNNCVAQDGKWVVKGMETPLYNHQVIGASWMLRREFSEDGPWGGILGDEMGMGKTLQALTCIVSNRPTEEDLKTCAALTLIVAPATSLTQWEEEIRKHATDKYIGGVFQYKKINSLEPAHLKMFTGIILVSYHELSRQFPSKKVRTALQNDCRSSEEWKETWDSHLGSLFKVPFWRVILDEAHTIKNKDTQISIACQSLLGRYRWAMSGTPITNSLDELYPYLKFLKVSWAGDFANFQYLYANTGDDESAQRLSVMMNILMLRRTLEDTFMGRPLYEIPMCHISVRRVRLTQEERVIYNVVESRFRAILNYILRICKKIRRDDIKIFLIYLLRLRQGAAHPFLLEPVLKKTLKKEDLLEIKGRLKEVGGRKPVFKQIGKWCSKAATAIIDSTIEVNENTEDSFGNSQFGYKFNINKQIDIALASQKEDVCRLCYQEPVNEYKAQCEHLFCEVCLDEHFQSERREGRIIPRCPDCDASLTEFEPLEESDSDDPDIDDSRSDKTSRRFQLSLPKQGRDSFKKHPKLKKSQSKFLRECDQAFPKPVVPSAKTVAVKEAILKWQAEAPDDKIIVFMEFKMTGEILGRMLNAEGIRFLYFFGDMSQVAKQNAIRGFHDRPDIKVMIASFRCGSVALNLTCANRVILVDLWWNMAIEMQAFSRVFRIGQRKETHFLRLIAQNTVDNRIEALQEQKLKDISKALEPGGRDDMSIETIAALFGHLQKSNNGSFEVLPDGEDDAEVDEIEEAEVIGDT